MMMKKFLFQIGSGTMTIDEVRDLFPAYEKDVLILTVIINYYLRAKQ